MNIENRLKKLETEIAKEEKPQLTVWDFSQTTTAQLLKLKDLLMFEGEAEAYTRQLTGEGFLNYSIIR